MLKPTDVTDLQVQMYIFETTGIFKRSYKELIAAAVNAFLPQDDGEPVTAEWLRSVGYTTRVSSGTLTSPPVPRDSPGLPRLGFIIGLNDDLLDSEGEMHQWQGSKTDSHCYFFKTRGNLRAWHKFSGQELKEVGK